MHQNNPVWDSSVWVHEEQGGRSTSVYPPRTGSSNANGHRSRYQLVSRKAKQKRQDTAGRCCLRLPHPSGGNGENIAWFRGTNKAASFSTRHASTGPLLLERREALKTFFRTTRPE